MKKGRGVRSPKMKRVVSVDGIVECLRDWDRVRYESNPCELVDPDAMWEMVRRKGAMYWDGEVGFLLLDKRHTDQKAWRLFSANWPESVSMAEVSRRLELLSKRVGTIYTIEHPEECLLAELFRSLANRGIAELVETEGDEQ